MPIPERMKPTFASARPAEADQIAEARQRLIVALDVPDAGAAEDLDEASLRGGDGPGTEDRS